MRPVEHRACTGPTRVSPGANPCLPALLAALLLLLPGLACGSNAPEVAAEISSSESPAGFVQIGKPAIASMRVENTGTEARTFFLGYSVRDVAGRWHDAPATSVELGAGEESGVEELLTPPLRTPGYYDSRVSVWSGEPASEGSRRIADRAATSTFRVSGEREDFDAPKLNPASWEATDRELGRGRLEPENVTVEEGSLRVTLPANSLDGGEIESRDLHGPGFYAARIKVPDAPSSITGFFLYAPPDLESEIDVEIFNDPSGRVLFTTYAGGEQTHTEEERLPFDPTKGFHDYAFSYDRNSVTFYVDGEPMKSYEGGLPDSRMRLYANSWYPAWLDGETPDRDRHAYVDWIER